MPTTWRFMAPARVFFGGFLALLLCGAHVEAADRTDLYSPDKAVHFRILSRQDRLRFSVEFHNRPVIEASPLQFTVDGVDLAREAAFAAITTSRTNETYPWRGVHSTATNHFNAASFTFVSGNRRFTIEARAFNEYLVPTIRERYR